MFTNTHSLARLYSALASGGTWRGRRLCSPESIEAVSRERVRGVDCFRELDMAFGLGFQKPTSRWPFSPNMRSFGHGGAGGSIAFADPDAKLAFAWMPTRMREGSPDARQTAIIDAVYGELG